MSLDRPEFEALTDADLQELVAAQAPESARLEYKRETYGSTDADKREYLKDLSALANTQGGNLVIGVEEDAGAASTLVGIPAESVDAEINRLTAIARSGLEPRIPRFQIKGIPIQNGKVVIVIRVPKSWIGPHRVVAQNSNRFYVRTTGGVHEPDVQELRMLFNETGSALENAKKWRDVRTIGIKSGTTTKTVVAGGRLLLHIVPVASASGQVRIDISKASELRQSFRPMGATFDNAAYNYDGFINDRGGENTTSYTQVFRNGCLESVMAPITREHNGATIIPGVATEQYFFQSIGGYIAGLRDLGVPPPLILMITMEGAKGAEYALARGVFDDATPPLPHDLLVLPECIVEDYGDVAELHRAIRPAFDGLWNTIGFACAGYFGEDGIWRNPRN